MLYWLMDLRYREIASEFLYHHYLKVKGKQGLCASRKSAIEREYEDLHLRWEVFDPNVRQLKREELYAERKGVCRLSSV